MKIKFPNLGIQIALALSAASALIYEVVATNVLFFYYIESSYSIATILGVFLLGLGLGSYLIYKFQNRIKNKKNLFGWLQITIGIYGFFILANLNDIIPKISPLGVFTVSTVIFLIPTIFLGSIFPLAGLIFKKEKKDIIGLVYSSDLIGAIIGTFLAGFVFVPILGNSATVFLGVILNLISAFVIFRHKKIIPAILIFIFLGLFFSPLAVFNQYYFNRQNNKLVKFIQNSSFGQVKVVKSEIGLILNIDNLDQCSYDPKGNVPEKDMIDDAFKHLKIKKPKSLNIGLGCGLTASRLVEKSQKTTDVIEVNPAVIKATEKFSQILENERINLIENEGLNYLRNVNRNYDLIVFTPDSPLRIHSSPLYTVDAFKLVQKRLNKNGVFSIMTIIEENEYLDVLYYSLKEVFDHVYHYPNTFVATNNKSGKKKYRPTSNYKINTIDKNTLTPIAEKYFSN